MILEALCNWNEHQWCVSVEAHSRPRSSTSPISIGDKQARSATQVKYGKGHKPTFNVRSNNMGLD